MSHIPAYYVNMTLIEFIHRAFHEPYLIHIFLTVDLYGSAFHEPHSIQCFLRLAIICEVCAGRTEDNRKLFDMARCQNFAFGTAHVKQ